MRVHTSSGAVAAATAAVVVLTLLMNISATVAAIWGIDDPYAEDAASQRSALQKLVKELRGRNPERVLPVRDKLTTAPLLVKIALAPRRIYLDDETQLMTLDAWTFLSWADEFLAWDPAENGQVEQVHLSTNDLWLPDIAVYNSVGDGRGVFGEVPVLVQSSGKVLWFPPTHVQVPCRLDVQLWPTDRHNCSVTVGSWAHHGATLDLSLMNNVSSGMVLENYLPNTGWQLVKHSAERRLLVLEDKRHVDIHFTFGLKRIAQVQSSFITAATLLAAFASLAPFLLPADDVLPRLVLHVFSLVVLVTCHVFLVLVLPSHAGHTPQVVRVVAGIEVAAVAAVAASLGLAAMARRRGGGGGGGGGGSGQRRQWDVAAVFRKNHKVGGSNRYSQLEDTNVDVDAMEHRHNANILTNNSGQPNTVVNLCDDPLHAGNKTTTHNAHTRQITMGSNAEPLTRNHYDETGTPTSTDNHNRTNRSTEVNTSKNDYPPSASDEVSPEKGPSVGFVSCSPAVLQQQQEQLQRHQQQTLNILNCLALVLFSVVFVVELVILRVTLGS